MALKSKRSHPQEMAQINVTPLVDVMLVLLVIFIVTAPLFKLQSMKVNLPRTVELNKSIQNKNSILAINSGGQIQFDGRAVSDADLILIFRAKMDPNFQVQIQADQAVPYGRVAELMAMAQTSGVTKISFATTAANRNK
jgi:biopolymer transport protein ExbD